MIIWNIIYTNNILRKCNHMCRCSRMSDTNNILRKYNHMCHCSRMSDTDNILRKCNYMCRCHRMLDIRPINMKCQSLDWMVRSIDEYIDNIYDTDTENITRKCKQINVTIYIGIRHWPTSINQTRLKSEIYVLHVKIRILE